MATSTEYYIPDIARRGEDLPLEKSLQDRLTAYVLEHFGDIKHGDTVVLQRPEDRERNSCVYVWDADLKRVIALGCHPDDYGTVPPHFLVTDTQFCPDYWTGVIGHNAYFWPDETIRQRAIKARKFGYPRFMSENPDRAVWYAEFKIGQKDCLMIFEDYEGDGPVSETETEPVFLKALRHAPWSCQCSAEFQGECDEREAEAAGVTILVVAQCGQTFYPYHEYDCGKCDAWSVCFCDKDTR